MEDRTAPSTPEALFPERMEQWALPTNPIELFVLAAQTCGADGLQSPGGVCVSLEGAD